MNDSEQPVTPPAAPAAVPPAQPTVPLTPVGVPAPAGGAPLPPAPAAPGSSNQTLIIILAAVGGVLLLGILFAICWFVLWNPKVKPQNLSNSFMKAITTGDVSKAVDLSGDSSNKNFLETAAKSVHGTYKLAASTYQNGTGYYLYTLSGADKDYARTVIAKQSGKLVVASFVYSDTKLNLIPGASEDTSSKSSTSSTNSTTTTSASCLVKSDYDAFGWTNTIEWTASSPYTGNVHFLADSLQYEDNIQTKLLEPLVDFYKETATKDYTIHLEGSVATTTESDRSFANQRAEKVKADLVGMGIPASKIVIGAPKNAADIGGVSSDTEAQLIRSVVWSIIPGCTGTSSSTSTSTSPSSSR